MGAPIGGALASVLHSFFDRSLEPLYEPESFSRRARQVCHHFCLDCAFGFINCHAKFSFSSRAPRSGRSEYVRVSYCKQIVLSVAVKDRIRW